MLVPLLLLHAVDGYALSLGARPAVAAPYTRAHHAHRSLVPRMSAFNVSTAVMAAGFAFEAYNEPSEDDARWERGADGIDVAFMSEEFAREVYDGILEVRLCEARQLAEQKELTQVLMSGAERDPYVIFAMNEENEEGPKEGAIGLGRAVDQVRSSTIWSKGLSEQWRNKGKEGCASWGDDEVHYLYVKDPSRAQLALTLFDEEVLVDDVALGATSVHMADLLKSRGTADDRSWDGWVPLTWRPAETRDNTVMMGTVAGAFVAGPAGAAAGGFIGSMIKKPVQGELRLELKYTPLKEARKLRSAPLATPAAAAAGGSPSAEGEVAPWSAPAIASGAAPKGASAGIDWSELATRVGVLGEDEREGYELCCFLTHKKSSSECAVWRKRSQRLLVVAFRGTSDVLDVLTDVNLLQTPLEQGFEGQKSDDPRRVHSGFFTSAQAVNRRLKELLVAACAGTPGEWDLLITGHSLGGAVATLLAPEFSGKVDSSRGFKAREDASWWGQAQRLVASAKEAIPGGELPRLGTVSLYTFGSPRCGNSEFAKYFDETFGPNAFRVVNDRDVVARLPRGSNAAGAVLDYEHVGRTVLVAEAEADGFDGFWVEGESDDATCPIRDVSPLSNPFSSGALLGDMGQQATDFASSTWSKINAAAEQKSREQLRDAITGAAEELEAGWSSIGKRVQQIGNNPLEAVGLIGLDYDFVQSEVKLAESLASGTAIDHHLEPSYFGAMTAALNAALDDEAAKRAAKDEAQSAGGGEEAVDA